MTNTEFKQFIAAYFITFPSTKEWLSKNSPDPAATLASWERTLSTTQIADALTVIGKLESGELEPIAAYDRDKTALIVRAYAGRIASDRAKRAESDRLISQGTRHQQTQRGPTMVGLFGQIMKLSETALQLYPEEKDCPPAKRYNVNAWVMEHMDWE